MDRTQAIYLVWSAAFLTTARPVRSVGSLSSTKAETHQATPSETQVHRRSPKFLRCDLHVRGLLVEIWNGDPSVLFGGDVHFGFSVDKSRKAAPREGAPPNTAAFPHHNLNGTWKLPDQLVGEPSQLPRLLAANNQESLLSNIFWVGFRATQIVYFWRLQLRL